MASSITLPGAVGSWGGGIVTGSGGAAATLHTCNARRPPTADRLVAHAACRTGKLWKSATGLRDWTERIIILNYRWCCTASFKTCDESDHVYRNFVSGTRRTGAADAGIAGLSSIPLGKLHGETGRGDEGFVRSSAFERTLDLSSLDVHAGKWEHSSFVEALMPKALYLTKM